jgi:signal transduction histidine kinase
MKLGTRLLIFSSLFLVMLPWFGFHFINKIEQSLLQGQEEAQSMAASAIATVLNGYSSLFDVDENALYVYPLEQDVMIDGYDEDWYQLKERFSAYANDAFSLLLLDNRQYLYAYLKVKDNNIVYRNPRYKPLDSSDHVRLEYLDTNNQHRRLILLAEGQGNVSVYEVNKDWQTWKNGHHLNSVYGVWRETKSGYDLELRLPRNWLELNRRLSFSVVNVFGENERNPESIVSTHSLEPGVLETGALNPLLFQSREISSVIRSLNESESRICVIDKYRRVRAVIGGQRLHTSLCQAVDKVSNRLVRQVLTDDSDITTRSTGQVTRLVDENETLIVAAHPVFDGDEIIGAVLVSKNSRQILSSQRETLNDVILATLALFVLVFISLLLFSSWLAYRINRLKNQTSSLIDESGRFISHIELSDSNHQDEIGQLSRSFSSLLDKLNSYTGFLETVPRMLRHEILNPVNTISMSLQSMQRKDNLSAGMTLDINAASNAVQQLQLIVSSLAEAANIDEALTQEEVEAVDLAALLSEYVHNSQRKHSDAKLRYQGVEQGVFVLGNDIRLVQLLDKIKDNAIDYALNNTEILFQLETKSNNEVIIRITNEGKFIPQEQLRLLFQGMISHRTEKTDTPHLGIGLYVAFQIAQFHHGQLQIANRGDKQGVEVVLVLPRMTS